MNRNRVSPIDAFTIRQVAEALSVSQRYVMKLISEGRLEGSFILGQMRFVPRSSVERLATLRSSKPAAISGTKEPSHAAAVAE
jgi:excisionase family DNA binding protein